MRPIHHEQQNNKAYEVFRIHGLDVSSIFNKGSLARSKGIDKVPGVVHKQDNERDDTILEGSMSCKLSFLQQVIEEGKTNLLQRTYGNGYEGLKVAIVGKNLIVISRYKQVVQKLRKFFSLGFITIG